MAAGLPAETIKAVIGFSAVPFPWSSFLAACSRALPRADSAFIWRWSLRSEDPNGFYRKGSTITQSSFYQPAIDLAAMRAGEVTLKLLVKGFTEPERQLLHAIVQLSQRRQPRISLIDIADGQNADVIMIDGADGEARKWAGSQAWLREKAVIWVDATGTPGHTVVQRPVQWSALPVMLARVLEQVPARMPATPGTASRHRSVLVVDDSIAVRSQVRALLEPHGFTVRDVDNAEAAIEAAAASSYACVLMDVLMPGMDGYEACRRIKAAAHGGNRSAVIMLTSKSSPFDRIRGKMAGCDAYLTKPIEPDHLHEAISRFIAKPAAGDAAIPRMTPPQYA